jgi:D-ribose pyranase
MKSGVLIHPRLLEMLASMGHTDDLLICDAGYPVPPGIPTVDLAYRPGQAPFLDVLAAVIGAIHLERATIATEATAELGAAIDVVLGAPADRIAHLALKERAHRCRGVVRTGEYTRYANVILTIGVAF